MLLSDRSLLPNSVLLELDLSFQHVTILFHRFLFTVYVDVSYNCLFFLSTNGFDFSM